MAGKYDYWRAAQSGNWVKTPFGNCVKCKNTTTPECGPPPGQPLQSVETLYPLDFLKQDWGTWTPAPLGKFKVAKFRSFRLIHSHVTYTNTIIEEFLDGTDPQLLFAASWYEAARIELKRWLDVQSSGALKTLPYPQLVNWTVNVAYLVTSMLLASNLYPTFWSDAVRLGSDLNWNPPVHQQFGWDQGFWWAAETYDDVQNGYNPVRKADGINQNCVVNSTIDVVRERKVERLHPFDQVSSNFKQKNGPANNCGFLPGIAAADRKYFKKDELWFGPQSGLNPGVIWFAAYSGIRGPISDAARSVNSKLILLNGELVEDHLKLFDHFPWAMKFATSTIAGNYLVNNKNATRADPSGKMRLIQLIQRAALFGGLELIFDSGLSGNGCKVAGDTLMRGSAQKYRRIADALSKMSFPYLVQNGVMAWQIRNKGMPYVLNQYSPPLVSMARQDMQEGIDDWENKTRKGKIRNAIVASFKFIEGLIKLFVNSDIFAYAKGVQATVKYGNQAADFKITDVPWDWSRDIDQPFIRIYVSSGRVNVLDDFKGKMSAAQKAQLIKEADASYGPGSGQGLADTATASFWALIPGLFSKLEKRIGMKLWQVEPPPPSTPLPPPISAPRTYYDIQKDPGSNLVKNPRSAATPWLFLTAAVGGIGFWLWRRNRRRI